MNKTVMTSLLTTMFLAWTAHTSFAALSSVAFPNQNSDEHIFLECKKLKSEVHQNSNFAAKVQSNAV